MANTVSQGRWREKNYAVKRQLNVMARNYVHETLEKIAHSQNLRGKAEAVSFTAFVVMALEQHARMNPEAEKLLLLYRQAYDQNRETYAP